MHEQELPMTLAVDLEGNFARLVEIYQDRLYAFALRLCGAPQDAEEVVVDAFVRAYRALGGYSDDRIQALSLKPWLYQITLNVFRNRVRGGRLPIVSLDSAEALSDVSAVDDVSNQPDAVFERSQLRQSLAGFITALPERERVAVVLRHVQGHSYDEIATLLEQPVGTVKANVHRGIRRLRQTLEQHEEWR